MSLFRPEALKARTNRGAEGIVIPRPRLFLLATVIALAVGVAAVAFAVLGSYSARIPASGSLRADLGLVSLAAPANGIAHRVFVEEGDRVEAGSLLVELQSGRADARGEELDDQIAEQIAQRQASLARTLEVQLRLIDERAAGLKTQISAARQESQRMREELQTRQRQTQLSNQALASARGMRERSFISETQLQQVESEALQRETEAKVLERELVGAGSKIAELELQLAELPGQRVLLQTQHERSMAELDQEALENSARASSSIKAPVTGRITAQLVHAGQSVSTGQALFAVLPEGAELEAHLYVSSRAVGFIREGATVQLRYQAFPYQKFGHQRGVVRRVSHSALGPAEQAALLGEVRSSEPVYRIVVQLDRQTVSAYGAEHALLPGMALEADILLERRRLVEWVFEPLYALRGVENE